jgi:hypothetical protein
MPRFNHGRGYIDIISMGRYDVSGSRPFPLGREIGFRSCSLVEWRGDDKALDEVSEKRMLFVYQTMIMIVKFQKNVIHVIRENIAF